MKRKYVIITVLFILTACFLIGCNNKNNISENVSDNQKSLNDILIGTWITTSGTADSTARIYKFYESGIMDSYIGSLKDEPLTGSYELDNDKIYMSYFDRSNPKENDKTPFTVVSYDENEIIVTAIGKTITWKRYE